MNDLQEKFLDTRFEMLASERLKEFWVITAWNPDGVVADAAVNRVADQNLAAELDRRALGRFRVFGGSPDGSHVEPGWGVDCREAAALELGRMFGQLAVFHFSEETIDLVDCRDGARFRLLPCPGRVVYPEQKRLFTVYVGSRAGRFEPADGDWLVQTVSKTFPSFTIQPSTGVFRGRREEVRLITIATADSRSVLNLADEIRRGLDQEGIGISCGGLYQRVCAWSDMDFIEDVFQG